MTPHAVHERCTSSVNPFPAELGKNFQKTKKLDFSIGSEQHRIHFFLRTSFFGQAFNVHKF